MSKCSCGYEISGSEKFCPSCGAPIAVQEAPVEPAQQIVAQPVQTNENAQDQQTNTQANAQQNASANNGDFSQKFNEYAKADDHTAEFEPNDIAGNKTMSIVSYISLLFLIPLFAAKDSPYAKFNANQGCVLFIAGVAVSILNSFFSMLMYYTPLFIDFFLNIITTVLWAASIVIWVFRIIGIVNVVQGKAKDLPFISKIKLIK